LLVIGGLSINVLPILMTLINVISCVIYLKGFPLKSKIQLYGMALFFLVFLYTSPSGLVFYWTLNNLFSLGKNALSRLPHKPVPKIRMPRAITGKLPRINSTQSKWIFRICCVFLALLTGLLIPSEVIKSSPDELSYPFFFSGTGSYPPLEKGLQRKIRHTVSSPPFSAPNRSIATSPYSEQVGIYLQQPLVLRGLTFLYSRIKPKSTCFGEKRLILLKGHFPMPQHLSSPYF
jgi:hypothetical protein